MTEQSDFDTELHEDYFSEVTQNAFIEKVLRNKDLCDRLVGLVDEGSNRNIF